MKKLILPVISICSIFLSCNKTIEIKQNTLSAVQITTNNIRFDSTSVTLSQATDVAKAFLSDIGHNPSITIKSAVTLTKKGVPFVHVINADNGVGFVIISADSCYTPVLAYNVKDNFSLDSKSLNAGIAFWFNSHSNSLDFIKTTKSAYTDSIKYHNKALWQELGKKYNLNGSSSAITSTTNGSTIRVSTNQFFPAPPPYYVTTVTTYQNPIGPLCGTNYDQTYPYNDDCPQVPNWVANPVDGNGRWLTGCGPTAMGQIMYFWQNPNPRYDWTKMKDLSGQGIHYIPLLLADIG